MSHASWPPRIGVRRRELLQVGYSALFGLSLPNVLRGRAIAADRGQGQARAKSVILAF